VIQELPPAKNADEYTPEERERIMEDAAAAAVLFAAHLRRLAEIDRELRRQRGNATDADA